MPSHNLQIPTFNPVTVTQLPKQSIWPGLAQGIAGGVGTLAKALDPVEKAQRRVTLGRLQMQTQALSDYRSGKIGADKFNALTGMPYSDRELLEMEYMKERNDRLKKENKYKDNSRNSTFGHDRDNPYSMDDVNGLPTQDDSFGPGGPVEPQLIPQPPQIESLPSTFGRGNFGG